MLRRLLRFNKKIQKVLSVTKYNYSLNIKYYIFRVDMTQTDYDNRTALHLASAEGHLECVEFQLKYCSVPPNPKDRLFNYS